MPYEEVQGGRPPQIHWYANIKKASQNEKQN